MKDIEIDGNEMPLGKMLKRIKAKGSKARKVVNNGSTPAVVETENNVDILGMLREINLDNVDVPNKFDSSNGHEKISSEAKLKRKGISNDLPNVSVPKRQRSSSAKGHKRSSFLKRESAFNITKMDEDAHSGSEDKDTGHMQIDKSKNSDEVDLEVMFLLGEINSNLILFFLKNCVCYSLMQKPKKPVKTDSNQKPGPVKKWKRRRISGLAKV